MTYTLTDFETISVLGRAALCCARIRSASPEGAQIDIQPDGRVTIVAVSHALLGAWVGRLPPPDRRVTTIVPHQILDAIRGAKGYVFELEIAATIITFRDKSTGQSTAFPPLDKMMPNWRALLKDDTDPWVPASGVFNPAIVAAATEFCYGVAIDTAKRAVDKAQAFKNALHLFQRSPSRAAVARVGQFLVALAPLVLKSGDDGPPDLGPFLEEADVRL